MHIVNAKNNTMHMSSVLFTLADLTETLSDLIVSNYPQKIIHLFFISSTIWLDAICQDEIHQESGQTYYGLQKNKAENNLFVLFSATFENEMNRQSHSSIY